ncbi:hypothetical protein B0H17DRAFT_1127741 [Mycena rosella]|uniref:Uncharacterized protein n=1 Tax=Mycena rosella TaxID=1033263 RepID=A0AAD7DYM8_MYCRO|nr:hypothetical protein B0H17DRAFT_1127741 [Mycena rosella]
MAVEDLVYGTFEADWNRLEVTKKDIVLDGLHQGACMSRSHLISAETPHRTRSNGNGHVKEIFFFFHLYVKHEHRHTEAAPAELKAFLYHALFLRNSFITAALIGILGSWHNRPARLHYAGKASSTLRKKDPQSSAKFTRAETENTAYEWMSPSAKNNECQKIDWTDHKKLGGKQSFDPSMLLPTSPEGSAEFIGCPAAVPGFIRTLALWRQIWYLSKPDSQSQAYHVNKPVGHLAHVLTEYDPV